MTNESIETQYKGYRFRSRLEARWAVFFDALGIEWRYELDRYFTGTNGTYLPDFWLPQIRAWVEVKPEYPDWGTRCKIEMLSHKHDALGIILYGEVSADSMIAFSNDIGENSAGSIETDHALWQKCNSCNEIYIDFGRSDRDFFYDTDFHKPYIYCSCLKDWPHGEARMVSGASVNDAIVAARSARFEHGEAPITAFMTQRLMPIDFLPVRHLVTCTINSFDDSYLERNIVLAGEVLSTYLTKDKRGQDMAIVKIGDSTGICNLVLFASAYAQMRQRVAEGQIVLAKGKAKKYKDDMCVWAEAVQNVYCPRIDPDDDPRALAKELGL